MNKKQILVFLVFFLSSCTTEIDNLTLLSNEPLDKTNFSINTKDGKNYKVYQESSLTKDQMYLLEQTLNGHTLVNVEHQANYGFVFNKKCTIKGNDVTK